MAVTANKHRPRSAKFVLNGRAPFASAFSVLLAMAFPLTAQAADWRLSPSVGASATYTDNANQSATNPEDALILSVTPGFSLISTGSRRVQATVNYTLSGVARFSEDSSTDLFHNLGAVGKAELVEDFLFLDATASVSQALISLVGSPADAATNDSNRATVGVYSLSPYIQKRLGTFATAQARYTTGGAIFGDNAASDSVSNSFSAGLNSGTRFNDLSWGLSYSLRQLDSSGTAGNSTFERASATLGYTLTRKFRVFGTYGEEWNDFLSASEADGSFYSIGFGWSPTRRTSVEASVGERYFGRTFSFSGNYRTRASNWRVSYSEDVSDVSQQLLQDSGRIFWVCDGRLIETPDLNPPSGRTNCDGPFTGAQVALGLSSRFPLSDFIAAGLLNISVANGVFVIKSLNAGVSWSKGRLGLGLSAYDTKRIYQAITGAEDHSQGVTGTVSYRLDAQTDANSSLSLSRNTSSAALLSSPARDDDLLSLSLGLNRRYSKDLSGALTFRHTQRDSNAVNSDYEENSLAASVNMRF
jgi:uncharacterized protein (PEP-CTERM system associated)